MTNPLIRRVFFTGASPFIDSDKLRYKQALHLLLNNTLKMLILSK